ncbi:MAG: VTT domain-containing protein [Candidatus Woesearchaeota archaeon]|jgi:membrane-associated protein|nr:VTT domain-containing protein [Candidatus Woesearchaeota archaeon]
MSLDFIFDYFEENIIFALSFFTFFSQIGVPLGAIFLIMFAGSSTYSISYLFLIILIIIIFTITGDIFAYKIGEKYGSKLLEKYKHKKFISKNYNKSEKAMSKYGSSSIFFTRFLITGLGPAMNYIAGLNKFDFKKFIIFIIFGEILYATIFASLGFFFKETWGELLTLISDFSLLIFLLLIGFFVTRKIYFLIKVDYA